MGCDIHIVLEKKFGDKWIGLQEASSVLRWHEVDGEWKCDHSFNRARERDYTAFGKLAGVRRDGPDPKGLPEDASELARALYPEDDSDLHSHSWCSLREFFEIKVSTEAHPAEVFLKDGHPAVTRPMSYYFGMYEPEEGEEYRVVFCFDN